MSPSEDIELKIRSKIAALLKLRAEQAKQQKEAEALLKCERELLKKAETIFRGLEGAKGLEERWIAAVEREDPDADFSDLTNVREALDNYGWLVTEDAIFDEEHAKVPKSLDAAEAKVWRWFVEGR